MVEDFTEVTALWLRERPLPVRATYSTPDRDRPTQVPVLLELLDVAGYPDVDALKSDLSDGFDMLGSIRPGPGWRKRSDDRYANPMPLASLATRNAEYLGSRLGKTNAGEYSDVLLDELIQETKLGRVLGPCRAPDDWKIKTVPIYDVVGMTELVEPPPGQVFVAASFPIVQFDEHGDPKIRRGEDWRRSGHNSTVEADDVPTHRFVGDFVDMARRFVAMDVVPLVLGHDLLSAYRQWAVKVPAHCGTFLPTRHGVTLWFHLAMCFGAAASAQSAFDGFADLFALLGLRTKPSKAQEPGSAHVVQGVTFQVRSDGVELRPTESRVAKLLAAIESALFSNRLAPAAAQRLAGKLTFLTQATFGAVGKAALKPVYALASDTSATSDDRAVSRAQVGTAGVGRPSSTSTASVLPLCAGLGALRRPLRRRVLPRGRPGAQSGFRPNVGPGVPA